MPDYIDITKYGTRGLRGTRASVAGDIEIDPTIEAIRKEARKSYHNKSYVDSAHDPGAVSNIGLELEQSGYGKSSYDKGIPYSQLENIDDWRGQEQSGIAQLGAGILKGITTAGTTFLDGTVGLLFGIGQMATSGGDLTMLFNNDLSKAFREFNQSMEEILPNYRTKDEIENPWAAKNLFSMNTFADDFLKNIGFTVGAFYSGNAYLSALKALGAGTMSTAAAKTIGSILSGFSEGRIEAGNLYDEQIKAEQPNIDAAKEQIKNEILSSPQYAQLGNQLTSEYESKKAAIEAQSDTFVAGVDGRMTSTKQAALQQLYNEYSTKLKQLENNAMLEVNKRTKALEDNVKKRAERAALVDLALNTIYLPFTDAYAYGKLYGRKFTGKNELARNIGERTTKAIDRAAEQEAIEETLGKRIVRKGKEYISNPVSAKKAALKGLKIGVSEGAEEMNQAWFSSFASNKFQPDSPDAYYNALTNDDYEIQTKDMMTSLTEGFMDSWGNAETYKEGLVGFLTGLIGMPTFGRVNNSDSNTYLGKGKMIGLFGGIFGEIRNSNRLNREASAAVETMNKLVDKVTDAKSFFIRAKSFTDATDGYSEANNKFEFNSAADNELFHAIDAFARTGRLQDLRDIIDVDIDNATQEQLEDIARNFSSNNNQFNNVDGSSMASTEEGQKQMKEIIKQRKQEISDGIDSYVEALEAARRISNNSLSADQVAELAWLKWKMDKFEDRFNSVKDKDLEKLNDLQNAIAAFKRGRGRGIIDEESEAGQNILKSIDNVEFFIDLLRSAKTPLQFGTLVKNSGNTRDWLKYLGYPIFEDMVGFNAEEFDSLMQDLNDVVKISEASEEFNKRYKEFKADPTKLIKNREKIDKKKNAEKAVKDKSDFKTALEDISVSEIAEKIRNQEITKDQIDSIEESERKAPIEPDVDPTVAQKIELAEQVNDARQRSIDALEERMQAEGSSQAIEDAIKQVEEAAANAQSPEDFFDLSQAAFVDAQLLAPDEPGVLTSEQEAALDEELQDRRNAATALNQEILDKVKKDREVAASMPAAQPTDDTEQDTTGHDETTKAGSVPQKEEKKEEKKQEPKIDYTREAVQLLQGAGIVAPTKSQVNMLATLLESLTKLTALNNNPLQSIASCRNQMAYRVLGREIDGNFNPDGLGQNNALSPLIDNMLLAYANQPTVTTQPQVEGTTIDTDIPTANPTRTQIEGQEAQESKRTFTLFPSGPMNFWKPATTEYPIHDNDRHNITYAKQLLNETVDKLIRLLPVADKDVATLRTHLLDVVKELLTKPLAEVQSSNSYRLAQLLIDANKLDNALQMLLDNKVAEVNLQRIRRTVAVTEFLQDKKAYDRLDSGQVQKKHNLSFVTYRELNEAAGETVILVVDDDLGDGAIIGDLMSKSEPVASNQIGLLPFIELCEKELEKHQGEDVIKLPGKSTVGQIMVGRVPYTNETNRPTLNTVFEGQPFRIGVAMTGGKNATIKSDSSPLSSSQSDEDASIWQPLNAIKGQPYILLSTGNADKKYVCIPFLMPVYNENVADSKLGKAIADNVGRIADAMTDKNAVSVKNALLELLSLKDMHINYNGDRVKVTITRHGETRQTTIYDGLASGDVMTNAILRSLHGVPFRINRKYINGDYNGMDYNSMIGELATCNLVQGTSSTINTWFTMGIVSVGSNGETSTSKPDRIKTTGTNPNARESNSSGGSTSGMITIGSSLVDPNTFEVYESDGKTPFKGDNNAIITRKARAFGIKNDLPMDEPYDTEWGRYDPRRNKIIPAEPPKVQPIKKSNVDATLLNEATYIVANMGEFTESELASALGLTGQFAATDIINELVSNGTIHQTGPFHYSWVGPKTNASKETPEQPAALDEEVPQGDILESGDTLNADAKAKGYLRTERRKNVWEALTLAQKNALLAMGKLKGEQTMKTLESPAYFDNNKREFKKDITSLLGGFKLRKTTSNKKVWNEQQERRWLAKVLPNLNQAERLRVVDAAIKVGNEKSPITAWGMFQNGIMTIWDRAAKGTLYHEAFHAVTDLLLTDDERKAMFDSARQAYGNLEQIALEEKLAEDFRRYVQLEEKPVIGRLIRLFRTLKHILQNLLGKEPYLNTLFYKINRGEFANREPKVINSNIVVKQNVTNTRYRLNGSKEEILRREMQRFLDNFGITLQEVDENYDGNLFDDLNRIIYYNSIEDITDGVGKAVAFMMQKQKVMTDLISLYNNFGNNTKGLKRGFKNVARAIDKAQSKEDKQKADFRLPGQKKDENISNALEAIGKDISKELRKLYGFGEEKPSFLNKVWDVIVEFFRMLTPQTRMMFDVIKHQSQHIANSIKINDKSLIVKGMVKPKTDTTATRVDVAQALRENPYEEGIIAHLSTKGIALAGSASIALNGTLYRPKENPLHDIDFQASQYNKESLDKIVEELSPYWMHTNTIEKEGEGSTETYMILDRPFVSEPYRIPKKNKEGETKGYTKVAVIRDKNTREILGYRINSDLILKDGVKGKMLDFFTGTESNPYGYHSMNLNGKNYLISDPRNALAAKVKWLRLKDLWDYNRYVPDDKMVSTNQQSDKEVAERVKNAKIIWGHPAIGKTTYIEKHKNEILEWDEEVNPKRDVFINEQVDPNGTLSDEERRQRKREYMRDWKDHPEYIAFLTREWEALKDRAKKEGKQIFASPTPLLNLFMDDFDLFLNLTEHEFLQRNQAREAGGYYSSLGWKQAINDALVRVNPDRLVTTDKYFSQIMGDDDMTPNETSGKTPTSSAELIHNTLNDIRSFYNNELAYGNLTQEQLDYLKEREITREQYNSMTMLEKETLFECMFG